ncbi:methyltransferase-like protein 24 [Elysia marginata]|uniref:Methyltransferase-like protein 24 n=1 Tax=Elysia marginata TaxID=1093978 RepID=A0AAV4F9B9_9GAST|nr:methyltransferase-like protein 24 [Elysia marginata]
MTYSKKTPFEDNHRKDQRQLSFLRRNSISHKLANIDIDQQMNDTQVALTLHSYLDNQDTVCRRKIRMGDMDDGGWEICDDEDVRPVPPCIIYSLGIGKDWTFDEDASRLYGCHVFSFDPSLGLEKHDRTPHIHFYPWGVGGETRVNGKGWPMFTLGDVKKKLGHENKVIDIVKMDIESSEWSALPEMLSSRELDSVRQLFVEYHVVFPASHRKSLKTIQAVEGDGWRKFYVHKNIHCARKQEGFPVRRTSCYEVMYLRSKEGV